MCIRDRVTQLQCGDAKAVALSGDRIAAITGCDGLASQQFGVTGWVTQLQCGDARAVGLEGSTGYAPPSSVNTTTDPPSKTPQPVTGPTTMCLRAQVTTSRAYGNYIAAKQRLKDSSSRFERSRLTRAAKKRRTAWRNALRRQRQSC